jgi:hypothetical protein
VHPQQSEPSLLLRIAAAMAPGMHKKTLWRAGNDGATWIKNENIAVHSKSDRLHSTQAWDFQSLKPRPEPQLWVAESDCTTKQTIILNHSRPL